MRRSILCLSATSLACFLGLPSPAADAAVGGPDSFGYTFADQDDGAVYNYVDISLTGEVLVDADDGNGTATLGAPFTIYGQTITELIAGTNGILTTAADNNPSDLSNSCPLPDGTAGDSFRVAVLHDDLITTAYYQYFDALQAAAVGYPLALGGISVFQWQGTFFGSAEPVDVEAILFHDTGEILIMHASAGEGGSESTTGLQEPLQGPGLTYVCDTDASVVGGTTAVHFFPPPPPIRINELRIDDPGADEEEYFELTGSPGASLDDVFYIVLGDSPSSNVEAVINLTGEALNLTGTYVAAEASFTLGVADGIHNLNFENGDTVTHMLVTEFTGAVGNVLDTDADGVLDVTPWTTVLDRVAVIEEGGEELGYGPPLACVESPTCQNAVLPGGTPAHVLRCPNGDGAWSTGAFDPAAGGADSPGLPNSCTCGDGTVISSEECDEIGPSATCDADCTFVVCGDGTPNVLAGEECDDAGESLVCDDDCTLALCGDSTVNMTAGEDCDDGGESVDCDADCTDVACGDGTVNMTAGEDCDDGGESASCNADCTVAACGDGIVNAAAGEDCDDGGESATCNADCTFASCGDGVANPTAGEDCDDGGESATCDLDCTVASCGDLTVNPTAGENCDDGGRSATCNADCTSASCGDGLVNVTAGEECDGDGAGTPGETDLCDDDCTAAMCGDNVVNATAGEDCDDGAESADCNDDCTTAACGDGVVNATAGEECDDGNTDDGDGCSAACETEDEPGTTGDTGDTDGETDGDTDGETDGDTEATSTSGVDDTAGDTDEDSGPGPVTNPGTSNGSDSSGDTGNGSSGATPIDDDGCSCSANNEDGGGTRWSLLALFGLAAFGRRRRRS